MALKIAVKGGRQQESLSSLPVATSQGVTLTVPGQVLIEADRDKDGALAFISGHGTYQSDVSGRAASGGDGGEASEAMDVDSPGTVRLCACVAGVVQRVNKLVTVVPPKQRYQGQIGDLVVGRITEVAAKRWKVDIRANKDAALLLSAVILPDGLQRIRGYEDQLQMRSFFQENDIISAEVQNLMGDGTVHLHTRTVRYGKLENGLVVYVRPSLVRRSKHHFITLPGAGVDIVLGINGYVWVSRSLSDGADGGEEEDGNLMSDKAELLLSQKKRHAETATTAQERMRIARARNSILLLDQEFLPISGDTILRVYRLSESLGVAPKDMLTSAGAETILSRLILSHEGGGHEG